MNTTEKKVSHTLGPWKLRKFERDNCRLTRVSDVPGKDYGVSTDDCDYTVCQHTTQANAKLIAAAPELLATLEKVRTAIRNSNMKNTILHEEIRRVIKKATE